MILEGKTLYPKAGKVEILLDDSEGAEKRQILSNRTIEGWVHRNNVIPGTGQMLREHVDEKRNELRRREREALQASIREQAEKQLQILTGLPIKTKEVRRYYRYDSEGKRTLTRRM